MTGHILQSKDRMLEQTSQITAGLLENMSKNYVPVLGITGESFSPLSLEEKKTKLLEDSNQS